MFFIKLVYPIKNIIIYICFVVYYNIYLPMLLYSDKMLMIYVKFFAMSKKCNIYRRCL